MVAVGTSNPSPCTSQREQEEGRTRNKRRYGASSRSSCDTILHPVATSLLVWSQDSIHAIQKVSPLGCEGPQEKRLATHGLLSFELLYELCIAPASDISESPGFMTPLGDIGARVCFRYSSRRVTCIAK